MGNGSPLAVAVPEFLSAEIERRLDEDDLELPMFPRVATEVLQLCRRPDSDGKSISEALHSDQSIAAHVLRVANSPMFGASIQISSLQQAVSRLGIRTLSEIVIAISLQARMFEIPTAWTPAVGSDLRQRSLVTAMFAKEIARMCRSNVETAFLVGLLRDMGKPVLCLLLGDVQRQRSIEFSLEQVGATLEAFHAVVGARLCAAWQFPAEIVDAIRHQADWQAMGADAPHGAALAALAARFAELAIESELALTVDALDLVALAELNLYRDDAARLCGMRDHLLDFAGVM